MLLSPPSFTITAPPKPTLWDVADLDIASNVDEDHRYNQGCSQNHRSVRTIRGDQLLLGGNFDEGGGALWGHRMFLLNF